MSEPVKKPIKFDSEDVYAINVPNTIPQVILTDESVTEIPVPSEVKSETIEKDCEIVVPNVLPKEELIDPDRVQITIPQDLPTQTLSERTMDELNPGPIKSTKIEEGEKTLNPDFKFLEEGKVSYQGEKPRFLKDFLSNDFKRNSDNTISIARNLLVDDGEYSFVLNTNDKTHSSNFVKIRVTAGVPTMIVTGRFESEDIQGTFKAVTENVVQTLVGNLSGIVDELFGELTGKGLYSVNSYIKGIFEIRDGSIFKSNIYGDTSIDIIIGQINGINNGLTELNELYELTDQELLAMQQSLLAIDELKNLVFDQEGYFDANKIKPLSIETTMLSVGAKPQRLYTSCLFQANYEGDKNKFYATDGTLTHFLYPEPLREWAITGTTLTLPDDSFRYIYARCLKNGNTGGILLSQAQLLLEDGDYYNFLIGVLSSVIGGTSRIATATFGQTTINGRFITTGRIQSADGLTYFDLDAGVIGGKIVFMAGSSGYSNLVDKPDLSVYSLQADVNAIVSNLQAQIDGQIMTWFDTYIPTLSNAPATSWTNDLERDKHLGDLFYDKSTGLGYRFSKTESVYSWELLRDTDVALALANAAAAQDTADGKRRVFVAQPTISDAYDVGDLWANATYSTTYSNELLRCKTAKAAGTAFDIAHWEKASKYTDDTAVNNLKNDVNAIVSNLQAQIDGQVMTWFDTYIPTLSNAPATSWTNDTDRDKHLGDLFYNKSTGLGYRFSKTGSVYSWELLKDTDVALALANAAAAQDTADGKRRVFVAQPTISDAYDVGDLWTNATYGTTYTNELLRCKTAKSAGVAFDIAHWEKASKYTDDTAANNASYIARSAQYGKMLYRDPMFKIGFNGIFIYNWYASGEPYITRISAPADSPNAGGYVVEILREDLGNETGPGHGGFYWGTIARANAILVTRLVAKIPVGFRIEFASNAIGNNADYRWLTSQDGSGRYQEYIFYLKCGDSGTFSSTNFFYLNGPAQQHTWYLAFATVYDLTDTDISIIDSKSRHFITTPTTPYYVGDTYTDGIKLYRCKTQRLSGDYSASEWELATTFDNTKTTIEGGLVTSGTVQVGSETYGGINVKAGITGQGSADDSVRLWAGATFLNRAVAPWRVLQNGHMFSAGWEFDEKRLYKENGNVEMVIDSEEMSIKMFLQGVEKLLLTGYDLPLLDSLKNPSSGNVYPTVNNVRQNVNGALVTYSVYSSNLVSLPNSNANYSIRVNYAKNALATSVNASVYANVYLANSSNVRIRKIGVIKLNFNGNYNNVVTVSSFTEAGSYKIELEVYYSDYSAYPGVYTGGTLTLGGAQSDSAISYSEQRQSSIIGRNGIASYWNTDKFFYLSQIANYFLELAGNVRILSGGNGIDIHSTGVNLKGRTRSNLRNYVNVQYANTPVVIDFVSDNVFVYFYVDSGCVVLPTFSNVAERLGLGSSDSFACRITIVCSTGSYNGRVYGRNGTFPNMNNVNYPQLYNNAGEISSNYISMSGSDRMEFLLEFSGGGVYRSYLLNNGT